MSEPVMNDDDVLVEVCAAGLNHLDLRIKSGEFKMLVPYSFPLILGHDVAGKVIAVGKNVRQLAVGDEVFARPRDGRIGAFAEKISIHQDDVAKKPSNLPMADAAGLPLVALTAWQALVEIAQVKAGQKAFIHAGAGGVGTIAIQLAKYLGAFVATTASTANVDFVKNLGADVVIDYKKQNFTDELKDYDVVLNSLDKKTLLNSLKVMKKGGRLISISGPPTPAYAKKADLNVFLQLAMYFLSRGVRCASCRKKVDYQFLFMQANGKQLAQIARLIEQGHIKPYTQSVYPFEQINQAFDELECGRTRGKIVVTMQ
ncbi:NADP-dependent oxidoreductase [Neisseria weixii]|nr:NADP-dependent oxidoreductase [Neisseria weixii]